MSNIENFTKVNFIDDLAERIGVKKTVARDIFDTFQDIIVERLDDGFAVCLDQLGKFKKVTKAARVARNLRTNEKIQVPEKQVISFKRKK